MNGDCTERWEEPVASHPVLSCPQSIHPLPQGTVTNTEHFQPTGNGPPARDTVHKTDRHTHSRCFVELTLFRIYQIGIPQGRA